MDMRNAGDELLIPAMLVIQLTAPLMRPFVSLGGIMCVLDFNVSILFRLE